MNIKSSVIAASCALLLCAVNGHLHAQQVESAVYDIVIERGMVIDPGTKFEGIANVGINAGKIAIVTSDKLHGRDVINARGLVVAPGFIDLHAHGQSKAADRMQAFDGVTTTLELESGILPVGDWYLQQQTNGRVLNYGTSAAWTFARIGEIEGIAPKADLLWYQKAFTLDKWVNQPASREQVAGIVAALEQGLREGAIGIGINAGYAPGGGYKELLALHALAAKYDVPTFTHISGDFPDDPRSAAESIGDIISMTVATGSHSHICHINSSSLKDIDTTLSMLAAAQADNLPITTESYTYGASSTTAGAALFTDEAREKKSINTHDIEFNGRALDDASFAELRSSEPGSVVVWHFLDLPKDEALLDKSVMFPGAAIASDAMPWTNRTTGLPVDDDAWPLADTSFAHPRSAGTYTKLLSHWVRERGLVSLSEAIRKSSLIPAQILEKSVPQMAKKGRLQAGMDADIIVFDPKTVRDRATFTQPYLASTGMSYVFVNGVAVIQRGRLLLDAAPGQPIRRAPTTN